MAESKYRLRPSSFDRLVACGGSLLLEEKYPSPDGTEALEGTAAHECARFKFEGLSYKVGDTDGNGTEITQEMLDGADDFVELVKSWGVEPVIEKQMPCASIHPECGGTPDAWGVDRPKKIIHLGDFKFGHRYVDIQTYQLIAYASGILDQLQVDPKDYMQWRIIFYICQPRFYAADRIRTRDVNVSSIAGNFETLKMVTRLSIGSSPECRTGYHCRDCGARKACVALQKSACNIMSVAQRVEDFDLDPSQTGQELRRLQQAWEILEARIAGLSESAISFIGQGKRVDGYEMVSETGREKWKAENEKDVAGFGEMLGIDLAKPREPVTPAQARKKGFNPDDFGLTYHSRGEPKLKPIDLSKTIAIFGDQ